MKALDLYCCAGGVSVGLQRAGFDVVGVDINPQPHYRGGRFVQADALDVLGDLEFLRSFDFIHASPPCQGHSVLRHLQPGKEYPDLIPATRAALQAAGVPFSIENVPGAPLGGFLTLLCGTMFGLQTPDGRAEIRRHRLFETSFSIALRPACQHGHRSMPVAGHAYEVVTKRQSDTLAVVGSGLPKTYSVDDARAAMGIDWMPMRALSQAIPPAYSEWIGRQAIAYLETRQ